MMKSDSIAALAAALAKAQSQIHGAIKDSTNPFFNSRYADLASVWEACRGPLTANGLAIVQTPSATFSGDAHIEQVTGKSGEKRSVLRSLATVTVVTALVHSSGEFIAGDVSALVASSDPQAIGSAITYLRRYGLAAMVGVPQIDDDAEAAVATTRDVKKADPATLPPSTVPASLLTLNDAQETRLKGLMQQHGVKASAVKKRIETATVYATGGAREPYPIKTAADIRQKDYDDICAWVIAGGK